MARRNTGRRAAAPLPPVGPVVVTQVTAATPYEIGYEWVIIANRPAGAGIWEPCMPREDWRVIKDMMDDGTLLTAQRRDHDRTVLLAKLRRTE